MNSTDFTVARRNFQECKFIETRLPDAGALPDEALLVKVERFAFTANNITYAMVGDQLKYWQLFPAPEGFGHPGMVRQQVAQRRVCDVGRAPWRERAQAVVHHREVRRHEIGNVAGQMKGHDLALPGAQDLVAAGQAIEDETTVAGPLTFANQIGILVKRLDAQGKGGDGAPVARRQLGDGFKFAYKPGVIRRRARGHNLLRGGGTPTGRMGVGTHAAIGEPRLGCFSPSVHNMDQPPPGG